MAKTLREQLAELGGSKKPNVFFKGLNTDVDPSLIGNDQYSDALNVNLDSKDADFASLQNLKGNLLADTLDLSVFYLSPATNDSGKSWLYENNSSAWTGSGNPTSTAGNYLRTIKFKFKKANGSYFAFSNGSDFIQIDTTESSLDTTSVEFSSQDRPKSGDTPIYTNDEAILFSAELLKKDSVFTAAFNITIVQKVTATTTTTLNLYFTPKDNSITPFDGAAVDVITTWGDTAEGSYSGVSCSPNTNSSDTFSSVSFTRALQPLGFSSFTGFISAICYVSSTEQAIVKLITDSSGAITEIVPVIHGNIGIASNTTKLFIVKIEENESFKRLYWTDGVNPVRTFNLESSLYDISLYNETDDFNLFPRNTLPILTVESVNVGGSINCGSWSYCYRLTTSSGGKSSTSPITNPIPLAKTNYGGLINTVVGGNIADNSNKNVVFSLSGIDTNFDEIELIGIHYLDNQGSAVFYSIKTESITESGSMTIVHTGSEPATVVTAEEILSRDNVWDIAQTLCIKDNRLFAGNLKSQSENLFSSPEIFKVKSYDHEFYMGKTTDSITSESWNDATIGSGDYVTYTGYVNPSLYNPDLYRHPIVHAQDVPDSSDKGAYRFTYGGANTHQPVLGAESNGFFNGYAYRYNDIEGSDSVRVSYRLKPFDLDEISLLRYSEQGGTDRNKAGVPYYGSFPKSEKGNEYNNYKSPIFAEQYVGYMRDEVYRFGIQFYDRTGNPTFTYTIGDLRMPSIEDDYRHFNSSATNIVHGGGSSGYPNKYILKDEAGNGYILHLRVEVILSPSTREKVSGFDIVRAERNDSDRRVVTAGLLNTTLQYADHSDNLTMQNKLGLDKIAVFSPNPSSTTSNYTQGNAGLAPVYTVDSPEVIFDRLNYTASGTDELKICNHLQCDRVLRPNDYNQLYDSNATNTDRIYWANDSASTQVNTSYVLYGITPKISYTVAPSLPFLVDNSMVSKYHCNDATNHKLSEGLVKQDYTASTQVNRKPITFGKTVEAGEIVDSSLISTSVSFQNSAVVYEKSTDDAKYKYLTINLESNLVRNNGGFIQNGNKTLLLSLGENDKFDFALDGNIYSSSSDAFSTKKIDKSNFLPSKSYVKIIRQFDNNSGQYGGNSESAFLNTRWISTGSYQEVTKAKNIYDFHVFGGDTYVNMFTLSKYHEETVAADTDKLTVQALVFPVESSINLDLRSGTFTGANTPKLEFEDDYSYDSSYSATNSTKSFPAKNFNIPNVTDLSNVIAASNIKLAGATNDAFSNFDSNETFEVDRNYGPIKNLSKLKDTVYCLQDKATSVLSINTRALIQSQDGSAIAIQSAVGTGNVVERNDYLSTEHGSQHIHNAISTDKGIYWVDALNASICAITISNSKTVINLSEILNCTKPLSPIKNLSINDSSLITSGSTAGGIDIMYDNFLNEINFSVSYYDGSAVQNLNLSYNEKLEIFTSKRSYVSFVNISHEGYNYSVGMQDTFVDDGRKKIYINGKGSSVNNFYGSNGSNPYVQIINNEEPNSLKTYDKISVYTKENPASGIFTKFAYSTDIDVEEVLDLSATDIDKVVINKQIVPTFVTKRLKGNHLSIKLEQVISGSSFLDFNLRSVTTHYRKTII